MTPQPEQPVARRRHAVALLAAVAWFGLAIAGCESFRQNGPMPAGTPEPAADKVTTAPAKRPAQHWLRVGQYVFYSDSPLDQHDPLFRELGELPDQIQTELRLPPGESMIQVFLFDTQDKYDAFLKSRYPKFPNRRAYFVAEPRGGSGDDLLVFTWMSENLRMDLRHELTHATLHSVLKGVPLWLDEGLAGFFELPANHNGINTSHLEVLRRGPFQPDLARLEKLGQVNQMEKPEYREAWAWVHLMLRGEPAARGVLLEYVQQLRSTSTPGPLLPKLRDALNDPNQALADHLTKSDFPTATARGQ
ncbi:hypothetical protein [Limnoglobus roseus]|uniref:DUF1570 domain-containing protein n=1 Tax=Limnoglobus roseus TaxID=2598579 RepID=A0A5C1A6T9_9BACT|nr:hypothetical protein [Limnoglobus roseus]QEL14901.1 hypothetical protein PX52LOC_01802 [Limnoglobus roseus]